MQSLKFFFCGTKDYSEQRVAELLHSDLANTLGNLLQRIMARKLHPWGEHEGRVFGPEDLVVHSPLDDVTTDLLNITQSLPGAYWAIYN